MLPSPKVVPIAELNEPVAKEDRLDELRHIDTSAMSVGELRPQAPTSQRPACPSLRSRPAAAPTGGRQEPEVRTPVRLFGAGALCRHAHPQRRSPPSVRPAGNCICRECAPWRSDAANERRLSRLVARYGSPRPAVARRTVLGPTRHQRGRAFFQIPTEREEKSRSPSSTDHLPGPHHRDQHRELRATQDAQVQEHLITGRAGGQCW